MLQLTAPAQVDRLEAAGCGEAVATCAVEAPPRSCRVSWRDRIAIRIGLWLLLRGCRPRREPSARRAATSSDAQRALRNHALGIERARAWSAYDAHRGAMNR